ncbi:Immunoglobulin subtype domain and Immunoglobulin-like domain and Immunoglobulin V-set domain and Immunoglobulin-like fold domain-containing protein [Strongyloides ratti]|uniref:Immunoglobulin subtype domain and Immunoglobulin-like domain and Immunoglobulin V-set domain and Immunoglobulin-like fold domain-containing protein n=1 Tax=Strongyloides ratti TaxID=34506 RepID=A0A090LNI1_STRRB|nr:Immunoglobulin subtype domain and Immunoglobulin-like domain and Immunoglobulin V-set domain and Immunoglobulin-like fold domain-containing protein [Strongyloides ratti]CEF71430.1 Immunoglobulin subtype domain and Immunoglobulin-like domain and Immunoglobulin V-set domain and Immunoglobulin-like fold domain-containing protein [Strongyloides ratti]
MKILNVTYNDLGIYQCLFKYSIVTKKFLTYNYNLLHNNVLIFEEGSYVNLICKNDELKSGKVILEETNLGNDNIYCLNDTYCHTLIKNGTKYDSNIFKCIKYIKDKITIIYEIILFNSNEENKYIENKHLSGIPYILKSISNAYEVEEGNTIYIPCIFKSFIFSSTLLSRWMFKIEYNRTYLYDKNYFVNTSIIDGRNFTILKISNISYYDTGTYVCEVASEYGLESREYYVYIKPTRPLIYYFKNIISFITISNLPLNEIIVRLTPHNNTLNIIEYVYDAKIVIKHWGNFRYKGYLNIEPFQNLNEKYNLTLAVSHKFSRSPFSTPINQNDYFILNDGFIDHNEENIFGKKKKDYQITRILLCLFVIVTVTVYFIYYFCPFFC